MTKVIQDHQYINYKDNNAYDADYQNAKLNIFCKNPSYLVKYY